MKRFFTVFLITHLFIQTSFAEKFQRINAVINKTKGFFGNIADGAYETWDDLKEVYDEVSTTVSDKTKKGYESVINRLNLKKYIFKQIGPAEVTLFQIGRNITYPDDQQLAKITNWLSAHVKKREMLEEETLNDYSALIENDNQKKVVLEIIEKIHATNSFKQLLVYNDIDFKQTQFDFLFALYANPLIQDNQDIIFDVYTGLAYAKILLRYELDLI